MSVTSEESIPVSPQRSGISEGDEEQAPDMPYDYPELPSSFTPRPEPAKLPKRRKGSIVVKHFMAMN